MITLKAPRDRKLIASEWWLEVVRRSQVDRKRTVLKVVGRSRVDRQLITLQTDGYPNSPLHQLPIPRGIVRKIADRSPRKWPNPKVAKLQVVKQWTNCEVAKLRGGQIAEPNCLLSK